MRKKNWIVIAAIWDATIIYVLNVVVIVIGKIVIIVKMDIVITIAVKIVVRVDTQKQIWNVMFVGVKVDGLYAFPVGVIRTNQRLTNLSTICKTNLTR